MDLAAGPAICEALERLRQPGLGIDRIHLCSLQQRRDCRPCLAAAVAAGKETVFSCDRLRSDRSLDDVGVELDTAVREEAFEHVTTLDRVP